MDRKTERIDENFDREIRKMAAKSEYQQYTRIYADPPVSTHYLAYKWVPQPSGLPLLETWQELKPVVQSKPPEVVDVQRVFREKRGTEDAGQADPVADGKRGADADGASQPEVADHTADAQSSENDSERKTLMVKSKADLLTIGAERGAEVHAGQNKAEMVATILDVKPKID